MPLQLSHSQNSLSQKVGKINLGHIENSFLPKKFEGETSKSNGSLIEAEREKIEETRPEPEVQPEEDKPPAQRTRSVKQMQALLDKNGPLCIPMITPGAKKGTF